MSDSLDEFCGWKLESCIIHVLKDLLRLHWSHFKSNVTSVHTVLAVSNCIEHDGPSYAVQVEVERVELILGHNAQYRGSMSRTPILAHILCGTWTCKQNSSTTVGKSRSGLTLSLLCLIRYNITNTEYDSDPMHGRTVLQLAI